MRVVKTRCDNPECVSEAAPEYDGVDLPYVPPYGWFLVEVQHIGQGNITVEVDQLSCIPPAIRHAYKEMYEREQ